VILEAREVVIRYRGAARPALDRASCGVRPAELVAVVGPNGSGKTTSSARSSACCPRRREVLAEGRPVEHWERGAFARLVGVVPAEEIVFPLTVAETIMLGLRAARPLARRGR
jgi:ABC-type cobalamin/Fe3+-siderophores transport system ATPase subunit